MNIKLTNVNYIYNPGTVNEKRAIRDISLEIRENEFIAIVGSTGSGKSSLIQLLNGLKMPSSGTIAYNGKIYGNDKKALCSIRSKVGIVFQYPEYQLFDETVLKDVSFGPKNMGFSKEEAEEKARDALQKVGLLESAYEKSPFDLSGGEKRRAAIAGILAMKPEILILDEPTAGLDPLGKRELLEFLKKEKNENKITIIMVSHNMDEVAEYAERMIVLSDGKVLLDGEPHEVFKNESILNEVGLMVPQVTSFCKKIGIEGPITLDEAVEAICSEISH